jgi:hypothetical protein
LDALNKKCSIESRHLMPLISIIVISVSIISKDARIPNGGMLASATLI